MDTVVQVKFLGFLKSILNNSPLLVGGVWCHVLKSVRRMECVSTVNYLTIIPRAWMGSESIAHEAERRMGCWLRGHEGERNNCLVKSKKGQIDGQKYRDKTT